MSQDLLAKLQNDANFRQQVQKSMERYNSLRHIDVSKTSQFIPDDILTKLENRQIYIYYGYLQPSDKKLLKQLAIYLINKFKPDPCKPYTLVFMNEQCADNYVLWNFKETFSWMKIEHIAAMKQFLIVKPYFYHKTIDWMTFGTVPRFIKSRSVFINSYKNLCDRIGIGETELKKFLPRALCKIQYPELFDELKNVSLHRFNIQGQQRNTIEQSKMLEFHKGISSMVIKPGYEVNYLHDYEQAAEGIPDILKILVLYFDSHEEDLDEEGLFRKSVSIDEENDTITQILSKNYDYLLQVKNPHIIANLIKRFFSTLKQPVFPFATYAKLLKEEGVTDKIQHLKQAYDELPDLNKRTLIFLFDFLRSKVMAHETRNKMNSHNLAVCISPCIFRSEKQTMADLVYASKNVGYCRLFITEFEAIFGTREEREAVYRKSWLQNRRSFQEQVGLQTEELTEEVFKFVKNSLIEQFEASPEKPCEQKKEESQSRESVESVKIEKLKQKQVQKYLEIRSPEKKTQETVEADFPAFLQQMVTLANNRSSSRFDALDYEQPCEQITIQPAQQNKQSLEHDV